MLDQSIAVYEMHCWGLQMVSDFVLRLTNLVVLIVDHDVVVMLLLAVRRIASGQEKKEFGWMDVWRLNPERIR